MAGPEVGLSWEFPNLVISNLIACEFYAEVLFALFCALLRSFADLHLNSFVLISALLCAFASFLERLRRALQTSSSPLQSVHQHISRISEISRLSKRWSDSAESSSTIGSSLESFEDNGLFRTEPFSQDHLFRSRGRHQHLATGCVYKHCPPSHCKRPKVGLPQKGVWQMGV